MASGGRADSVHILWQSILSDKSICRGTHAIHRPNVSLGIVLIIPSENADRGPSGFLTIHVTALPCAINRHIGNPIPYSHISDQSSIPTRLCYKG